MSKIEGMLKRLCPNGVERKPLVQAVSVKRGVRVVKQQLAETGVYPVYQNCLTAMGYYAESNCSGDTAFVIAAGAAGSVGYCDVDFWAADDCYYMVAPKEINNKFLYYTMKSKEPLLLSKVRKASVPRLARDVVESMEIPLPPRPVQDEIVKALDAMDAVVKSLEEERAARQEQFEALRERMINFDESVERRQLAEVFDLRNGYTPSKANSSFWDGGTIPWFRMEDIRENGRILSDAILHVTDRSIKGELFSADSLIVSTSATIGEHAWITVPALANQRFTNLTISTEYKSRLLMPFVFYLGFAIDDYCRKNTCKGNFASVDMGKFKQFPIPLPSLSVQKKIAAQLDAFAAVVAALDEEIAARREQFAGWLEKLMKFDAREVAVA